MKPNEGADDLKMEKQHIAVYQSLSYIPMFIIAILGIIALCSEGYFGYCFFDQGLWTGMTTNEIRSGSYRNLGRSVVPVIFAGLFLLLPPIISLINQHYKKRAFALASTVCATIGLVYIIVSSIYFSENYDFYGYATYNGNYYYVFDSFTLMFYIELILHIAMVLISVLDAIGKPIFKKSCKCPVHNNESDTASLKTFNESNIDEIKKYQALLDQGVITQEEFDAKKKQLLGL